MSKLSQVHAKPVGEPVAVPCIGYCARHYEAALERVDFDHPEWTRARRSQRAWVEMFKRTAAPGGDLQVSGV